MDTMDTSTNATNAKAPIAARYGLTAEEINAPYPMEAPPISWRTQPYEWSVDALKNATTGAPLKRSADLLARLIVEGPMVEVTAGDVYVQADPFAYVSEEDTLAIARLFYSVVSGQPYHFRHSCSWIMYGEGMAIPAHPIGLSFLARMRTVANSVLVRVRETPIECATDGEMATIQEALRQASSGYDRGVFHVATNGTSNANGTGIVLNLAVHHPVMPSGKVLPGSLLSQSLEGFEMSGSDAMQLMSEADMCASGSAEFLRANGIQFSTEGTLHECDSCGAERESEEDGEIDWVEDFTWTADRLESMDSYGFLDALREFVGRDEYAETWSVLLDEGTNAEILAEHTPPVGPIDPDKAPVTYDPTLWEFIPDFAAVEGLEDESLEFETLARLLPLLQEIATAYASAHVLPAFPGTLRARHDAKVAFAWDPAIGSLTHEASARVRIRYHVTDPDNAVVFLEGRQYHAKVEYCNLRLRLPDRVLEKDHLIMLAFLQGEAVL